MAAEATRVKVTYRTFYDIEFTVTFYVAPGIVDPNNGSVQAIVTAINAITRAVAIRIELSASNPHSVTATAGAIYVNEDKGEFVFQGPAGAHTFKLPGPDPSFVSSTDNETIDASSGAVGDFVAAVAEFAFDANGGVITAPTEGRRRAARKALKK